LEFFFEHVHAGEVEVVVSGACDLVAFDDAAERSDREAFLASFRNEAGFRAHFIATALASRTERKHQPPNAQSDYVTYAFERLQWSKPLFVLALYTGLRRSDLRLLKWTSIDLSAGVIRLVMRKTKRPVLLPIVPRVRAALDECRKRT